MNTAVYKENYGVSRTLYRNLLKSNLILDKDKPTAELVHVYKKARKKRKAALKEIQVKKHQEAKRVRRLSSKPRKRKDGKVRGSVGSRP